jgi:predicted acylesterase/phospholipase RssA
MLGNDAVLYAAGRGRGMSCSDLDAARFLAGAHLKFAEADALWRCLKKRDAISLARRVLNRMRGGNTLRDRIPAAAHQELCQQEAELTSKDPELPSATRHDEALSLLDQLLIAPTAETLGIAGGICKRKWGDLGQLADLKRAADFYERGAAGPLGDDAYPHINAAFLDDLLASSGDSSIARRQRARALRQRIVDELKPRDDWWNVATRAEALFGLGCNEDGRYDKDHDNKTNYDKAAALLNAFADRPEPWKLRVTALQLAQLATLQQAPLDDPAIRAVWKALLPGSADAVRLVSLGKVGLALSGGGFRASFFHLGVLAFLAERNILRHVEVLSCVSGGSIVGAAYWLALRTLLENHEQVQHSDYIALVKALIHDFQTAVSQDLRRAIQPGKPGMVWRFLNDEKGAVDPEKAANRLEEWFYAPNWKGKTPIHMHDLWFQPAGHEAGSNGENKFNTTKHNWLRADKVPSLILNATTVNTGHAWQFTPTWMGEAPWSIYQSADSISRLEWSEYNDGAGWKITLGRAVAASSCVPGVFAPLKIDAEYEDQEMRVSLVDGGVHDNQGTVSLLSANCNLLLVSDACGQLALERSSTEGVAGLGKYAMRSMETLMERVRLANFADLDARRRSGLLRGLMFLHMKDGLDADVIRLKFSQEIRQITRAPLSPLGVRKDFQAALAELRTDLDDFSGNESLALMACGYQMAAGRFELDLEGLAVWDAKIETTWPFTEMLQEITSPLQHTSKREPLLAELRKGKTVQI